MRYYIFPIAASRKIYALYECVNWTTILVVLNIIISQLREHISGCAIISIYNISQGFRRTEIEIRCYQFIYLS